MSELRCNLWETVGRKMAPTPPGGIGGAYERSPILRLPGATHSSIVGRHRFRRSAPVALLWPHVRAGRVPCRLLMRLSPARRARQGAIDGLPAGVIQFGGCALRHTACPWARAGRGRAGWPLAEGQACASRRPAPGLAEAAESGASDRLCVLLPATQRRLRVRPQAGASRPGG